jgi:hypothetical protein
VTGEVTADEGSYLLVIGEDLPSGLATEDLIAFRDNYCQVYLPGVVNCTDGVLRGTRYELIGPDPRGDLGPGWLSVYELGGEEAAAGYLGRAPADVLPPGPAGCRVRWHVVWQRRPGYAGAIGRWGRPYLYLIGMDVPTGSDDGELAAFNAFYDETHLPAVVRALGYERGLRFERAGCLAHPGPGCPRFMAVYDGDERSVRRAAEGIPPDAIPMDGPAAWNNRQTAWRLLYRRVSSYARSVGEGLP